MAYTRRYHEAESRKTAVTSSVARQLPLVWSLSHRLETSSLLALATVTV